MPIAAVISGGKPINIHYVIHGAQTQVHHLSQLHSTAHRPALNATQTLPTANAATTDNSIDPAALTTAGTEGQPSAPPQHAISPLALDPDYTPQKLVLVSAYAAKADTSWAAHIVNHLSSLTDDIGRPLFSILCYDSRGVGQSSKPKSMFSYTTDTMAEDVLALMEYIGWENEVSMFGWSLGGLVAMKAAAKQPTRFHTMTLVGVTQYGYQMLLGLTLLSPINFIGMLLAPLSRRIKVWTTLRRFFTKEWLDKLVDSGIDTGTNGTASGTGTTSGIGTGNSSDSRTIDVPSNTTTTNGNNDTTPTTTATATNRVVTASSSRENKKKTSTRRKLLMQHSMEPTRLNLVMDSHMTTKGHAWAAITHTLTPTDIQKIKNARLNQRTLLIHGLRDDTAKHRYGVALAKTLDCPVVSPNASHAGLLIECSELVVAGLENAVLGRCVSSVEEREKVKRDGESAMLKTSFYF